jgi:two-component sensor histidine kinase
MKKETENISGSDIEKRILQFEARQAEFEKRIEDLMTAKAAAEADARKFREFYELTSMGYYTLTPDSTICGLNSSGAGILGGGSKTFVNRKFKAFVAPETQPAFDEFMQKVFTAVSKQECELKLKIENGISGFIHIEGMASGDKEKCNITATDTTDCRLAEETVYNLLNEKEIILKEVHHRVKNNMYNIGALLNMQANAQDDPAAKSVLFDAAGRVQSMSVLYDKLYRSEHVSAVSLKEYLPDLVYEIVGIFPHKKSVKVKTRVDDIVLDAKLLSVLGILVNELITNSMKYAFTGRSDGVITVNVSKNNKMITIIIADNGIGIPETVTFENSAGFGMQLTAMLTEQIGGSIRIERGEGTRFVLEFEV